LYNNKILKFLLVVVITGLLSAFGASLESGSAKVTVSQKMLVAGNEIKAGQYLVQWEPNGTGSAVTFKSQGEAVVKVTGKITRTEKKSQYDSVLSAKDSDGRSLIKAIELGEKQIRIAFE
jgi:hypothetical protein